MVNVFFINILKGLTHFDFNPELSASINFNIDNGRERLCVAFEWCQNQVNPRRISVFSIHATSQNSERYSWKYWPEYRRSFWPEIFRRYWTPEMSVYHGSAYRRHKNIKKYFLVWLMIKQNLPLIKLILNQVVPNCDACHFWTLHKK